MGPIVIREFAPAKINLFLHVGEKRADGFHAVQSLVAFAAIGDDLEFAPADELSLEIKGPYAGSLQSDADNLALKAARALAQEVGVKSAAKIALTKNLPVASGIGGGSADAAATLRGLQRLWQIELPGQTRAKIAEALGSDVPVCVASQPSWMEGRGEHVTSAGVLPPLAIVLANPGLAVSTAAIFAALAARRGVGDVKPAAWSSVGELISYLKGTTNDLESPARKVAPVVVEVLEALASCVGVLLTRMSGSGATCFSLFESDAGARAAARQISERHPSWWVVPSRLLTTPPR